ncbi:MAG: nucleotidyl transferase AbiEii/AbiGii toxin family protein [Candidatus Moranbacteria bacterium]|nr:nucleotidyl transferase AbiEii/AbiGii toxin family protein [Candidatus Moranbacteria bacterium]
MQLPQPKDAKHKAWLYRILSSFYDDAHLSSILYFKGGTCAAMLGILDRFSVDLDFDFVGKEKDLDATRKRMESIFSDLGLEIKDKSRRIPQYFLRYPSGDGERNTLKIDVSFPHPKSNKYEARRFSEIDRIITCQTSETMFANKLVALMDRYDKKKSIAGRDVYDIHHFFESGLRYDADVIKERTGGSVRMFFKKLIVFIDKHVTDELISQDMNVLLSYAKFRIIRKTLRQETLMYLKDELARIQSSE